MAAQQCRHCGRWFDTRLVDVRHHEEGCKRHLADQLAKNIARFWQGKPPVRR